MSQLLNTSDHRSAPHQPKCLNFFHCLRRIVYDELKILKIRDIYVILLLNLCFVSTTNYYREYLMRTLCDMMYKYKYTNDTRMPICADSRLLRKVVAEEVLVFAE